MNIRQKVYMLYRVLNGITHRIPFIYSLRVKIGKRLSVCTKMRIIGPGVVDIGTNVKIDEPVVLRTRNKHSKIIIGDNTYLNGTQIDCTSMIVIGKKAMLANCILMDTDFHSTDPLHREDPTYIKTSPITIGDNTWLTTGVMVLKGVTIGNNSVITPRVVVNRPVPSNVVFGAYPGSILKWLS